MVDLGNVFKELAPTITKICNISGAAGASIGILHHNQVYTANYGYRDVAEKLPPDEHTIYHLASLSKSFTAASLGILKHENTIDWDDPVSKFLPDFSHDNLNIRQNATIMDFLAHRTGLATKNALWAQDGVDLLMRPVDLSPTVSYLEVVKPFRSTWLYNNWGYNVAAAVIEEVSGMTWGSFLSEHILEPLGMHRTISAQRFPIDNVAKAYISSRDGTPTLVESPIIASGTIMEGANGLKSSVSDLLKYFSAVIKASKQSGGSASTASTETPLKNIGDLLSPRIPLDPQSQYEEFYGAGWAITQLPSPVGSIGINGMFVEQMPVVGKGSKKRLLWYHNGSLVGFFSSIHILPDTGTAIIVLVNSLAKNDCADWLGQLLLEAVLDNPDKNDYVALAEASAAAYEHMWDQVKVDLDNSKCPSPIQRPLEEYIGKYFNKPKNWFIDVHLVSGHLQFQFQGLSSQTHQLHHHNVDTFSWLLSEQESLSLGRWPDLDAPTYIFHFATDEHGQINTLRWVHDGDVPDGETFIRDDGSAVGYQQANMHLVDALGRGAETR